MASSLLGDSSFEVASGRVLKILDQVEIEVGVPPSPRRIGDPGCHDHCRGPARDHLHRVLGRPGSVTVRSAVAIAAGVLVWPRRLPKCSNRAMVERSQRIDRESAHSGYDLLRLRAVAGLVNWTGFPYVFQAVTLVLFVALAVVSWRVVAPSDVPDKLFAKANLTQLLVWGLWWPAMVWAAVFLGRAWCAVCPLELVANVGERLGRRLGLRQRGLGVWLRSGALVVALYLLVQMLVAGIHLHRVPAYTSLFLWIMLAGAVVVGLFFKDRAFCRGFCPVATLLNAYGRGGVLAVRPGSAEACASCEGRDCVDAGNRTRWQGPSCPSLLNPARLTQSSDCLICGQCLTACPTHDLQLLLRRPFPASDARERRASKVITTFVLIASGFVTYELCTEWAAAKSVFLWVPNQVGPLLGLAAGNGWVKGVWTLLVFPALLWLLLGGLTVLLSGARSLGDAWRRLALPLVVVIAAGHLAKGLAKFASWGGFFPPALADPEGSETARAIAAETMEAPGPLLGKFWVSLVGVLLILLAGAFALREARLADGERVGRLGMPILVLTAGFGILACGWGLVTF